MRTGSVAFLAGIVVLMQLPELPDVRWCFLLVPSIFLLILFPRLFIPLSVLCGLLWALWHADRIVTSRLSPDLEGQDLIVVGTIMTLPERNNVLTRFNFNVESIEHDSVIDTAALTARLSWYGRRPQLKTGERWRLIVRMKRPHGFSNPGGFDYERWLFQQGIGATGYVRHDQRNNCLTEDRLALSWRQQLADRLTERLSGDDFGGMITALAIGNRQGISPEQWQVLTRTGTSHLVAISGLHIGLVAGFVFFLSRWLWSRSTRLTLVRPAQQAAAIAGVAAAILYAALAGFAIPTQRALIMVVVMIIGVLSQRRLMPVNSLSLALFSVLVYDPLAVLSAGFWLSFAAVAVILWTMTGRLRISDWWWKLCRLHIVIAIGLMPLLLIQFQQVPLLSPLANVVAVPWISFVIVPFVLSGTILLLVWPPAGQCLLTGASWGLALMWRWLEWLANVDWAQWQQTAPPLWTWPFAGLAILLCLMPRGLPARWLGLVFILPALIVKPPRPLPGECWFTLLDVGQGLAAVIETPNHVLVYDAGPRFSENFDAGAAVVGPYLHASGVSRIDRLLVGHGDSDHIGGVPSLQLEFAIDSVLTSVVQQIDARQVEACRQGQHWQWDGVDFLLLHPDPGSRQQGNNASCVLKISLGGQSILLTGDIERDAERLLLTGQPDTLHSNILVVPHHGSLTSSSPGFVAAVRPEYALIPAGYRNRYGFPKQAVTERYRAVRARILTTGYDGAIMVRFRTGQPYQVETYRHLQRHFWQS